MTGAEEAGSPQRLESQALVRAALHSAGTTVWEWNPITDELSGADGEVALLGYSRDESSGTQAAWNLVIHPDEREENDRCYQRHAQGETPFYEHEYRARAKDGGWRWISERGRIVEWTADGRPLRVVGTLSDVTLRREAESRALAMLEQFASTARQVPGIVYQYRLRTDGQGLFCYVSESCQRVIGVAAADLLRDPSIIFRMIEREDHPVAIESMRRSARELTPWRCEFRVRRADGQVRWISGASTPQREPDGSVLWYGYLEDSTEVHELHLAREAAAVAQAANRAKTEFLSRMSHELRTPLNAVMGFSQLLQIDRAEPLTANQRRRVALIHEAGAHLLTMIGELLDLTRIESGNLTLDWSDVSLPVLLSDCLDLMRPSADTAAVRLADVDVEPTLTLRADATRLRQVILNLVSNAIKYNRSGGWVRVSAARTPEAVVVQVADSGVGIAAEHLSSLGEAFNRLGQVRSAVEGTGIGLAVTRGLVELMGGRLEVASTEAVGSTFSVVFPSVPEASAA